MLTEPTYSARRRRRRCRRRRRGRGCPGRVERRDALAAPPFGLAGLEGQLPPRVALGEQRVDVGIGAAPTAGCRPAGRSLRGRRPGRSPAPSGRSPAGRPPARRRRSHGCSATTRVDRQRPGRSRGRAPRRRRVRPSRWRRRAPAGPGLRLRKSRSRPSRPCSAAIQSSRSGGVTPHGVGERPEPQGAPGVHHPAQPLVGAVGVVERGLDLLAQHAPGYAAARRVPTTGMCAAGLGLGDLQPAQRQRPQSLDARGRARRGRPSASWSAWP